MKLTPHPSRISPKIAEAVAALKVADAKLVALAPDKRDPMRLDVYDIHGATMTARTFARLLEPWADSAPAWPRRVYRAIRGHKNKCRRNPANLEAAGIKLLVVSMAIATLGFILFAIAGM